MVDFAKLRKNSSLEKLTKALESQAGSRFSKDERLWELTVDKAGNGFAVIRFLDAPAVDGEDAVPAVLLWNHAFKGPSGQWYIENCLTTINCDDPVCQLNNKLWNSGLEANKKRVSDQKRKLTYISNILVINDPAHPENNGKHFLFRYGKKIMDKIKDKSGILDGKNDGEVPTYRDPDDMIYNPFNFWEGGNFKLTARKVEGYRNYDKSTFDLKSSPLFGGDDEKIEKLWKSEYSLKAEIDPKSKFKSFDELKSKLEKVLGLSNETSVSSNRVTAEQVSISEAVEGDVPSVSQVDAEIQAAVNSSSDDEDEFADFARLAQ